MARKSSSSAQGARPDVASRSQFDALAVDTIDSSSESDSEPSPALSTPLLAPPSSKKAAARRRAQLRKNAPESTTEVDSSTEAAFVPPVPALPVMLKSGVEKLEKKIARIVEVATAPKALSTPENPTVLPTESASSSDAETADQYTDDDVSDLDEPSPSPTPLAVSPRPSSPSPPHSPIDAAVPVYTGADHDPKKKLQAIIQRTVAGILMASSLVAIVCLGHVYVIVLVFVCQAVVFSELSVLFDAGSSAGTVVEQGGDQKSLEREVRRRGRREERDRWSRRISWYFFAATNYFLYGESLIYYFKHILTLQASFLPTAFSFAQHHRLISFGLYVIGFVSFVANLKRNQLRRQFGLFGWIHMSLLVVVVSSHFIVNNILEGLIWFWVPASLVITNDIAAYVCGMLFGRHQLIKLSPKKTVEGFVGAFFVTIVFAVAWGTFFMRFNYMICPVQDLATNVLSDIQCVPNRVFVWREFPLPGWAVSGLFSLTHRTFSLIPWNPFQLHCVVMAIFASLVAPFGGFFASGFKRAFNIKDFGASIPGHGGVTDRMDCQFLMGLFAYVYYASLIRETHITVGSVLATVVSALTTEQQLELVKEVGKVLAAKGVKAAVPW